MQTNLKSFEDRLIPPGGDPPPDGKPKAWLPPVIATAAAGVLAGCDIGLGEEIFVDPKSEEEKEDTPDEWEEETPYDPKPGDGEIYYPPVSTPLPPEKISTVASWNDCNFIIEDDKTLDFIFHESDKDFRAGVKIDLAEYYRLCGEAGVTPSTITFKFERLTLEQLKNFTFSLLDSTSAEEKKPSDAHTCYVRLKDQISLARSNTSFDENTLTVTLDLTKRRIDKLNIMTDKGEESDPTDASYISNVKINDAGSFSFDVAARPTGKEGWAFAGVYYDAKFDLPANTTFDYSLSGFIPPVYGYAEQDTGYRIVFSYGEKEKDNYRELVYDPTGFSDGKTTEVPAGRVHESYLALREAEVETLGSNNLRMKFYGQDSRVTVNDIEEQKYIFNLNNDDRRDTTKWSRLTFKVKKYGGLSKDNFLEDFLTNVVAGVIVSDGVDSYICQSEVVTDARGVTCAEYGDYYEVSLPLRYFSGIPNYDCGFMGVSFSGVVGSKEFEVSDIKISTVGQGERSLALPKTNRTGFTGFSAALDNKNAQAGITLSGLKVGSQEISVPPADLDSEVKAFTLSSYTGYYPDDDEEKPFVDTGKVHGLVKALEEQGVFFVKEVEPQTEQPEETAE